MTDKPDSKDKKAQAPVQRTDLKLAREAQAPQIDMGESEGERKTRSSQRPAAPAPRRPATPDDEG